MKKAKKVFFVMILVALAVCVVGTTLAWLTDQSDEVVNTFTPSTVGLTLTESETYEIVEGTQGRNFDMVPGWTIDKDPKVTVTAGSEDCYVFIQVNESANLDDFIAYAVKTETDENVTGDYKWTAVPDATNVFYMEVTDVTADKEFYILGKGTYVDPMGTTDEGQTGDDVTVTWKANQVATKPSVTEEMMRGLTANPTLSFKAYAIQLWQTNPSNDDPNTNDVNEAKFAPETAWNLAKGTAQAGN